MEASLQFLFLVRPEGKRGNGRPQAPAREGRVIGEAVSLAKTAASHVRWRFQFAKYTGRNSEQFTASMIGHSP
jgi:hypothetical protein